MRDDSIISNGKYSWRFKQHTGDPDLVECEITLSRMLFCPKCAAFEVLHWQLVPRHFKPEPPGQNVNHLSSEFCRVCRVGVVGAFLRDPHDVL